jgi:hypothetical protein
VSVASEGLLVLDLGDRAKPLGLELSKLRFDPDQPGFEGSSPEPAVVLGRHLLDR